jgi:hypothetical protein
VRISSFREDVIYSFRVATFILMLALDAGLELAITQMNGGLQRRCAHLMAASLTDPGPVCEHSNPTVRKEPVLGKPRLYVTLLSQQPRSGKMSAALHGDFALVLIATTMQLISIVAPDVQSGVCRFTVFQHYPESQ